MKSRGMRDRLVALSSAYMVVTACGFPLKYSERIIPTILPSKFLGTAMPFVLPRSEKKFLQALTCRRNLRSS